MRPVSCVLLIALLLGSTSCALFRGSPPTTFYLLSSLASENPELIPRISSQGPRIGVGPVELPRHLDRSQIVTGATVNRLRLAEFHNWAEPLQDNFAAVLAENLAVILKTNRLSVYPWRRAFQPDYQVSVRVGRFGAERDGTVLLDCRWVLADRKGRVLVSQVARFTDEADVDDYDEVAAAMSRTVAALSRDIAQGIPAK